MIKCTESSECPKNKGICCNYCDEKCESACDLKSDDCECAYEDDNALTLFNDAAMTVMKNVSALIEQKKALEEQEKGMREELTALMDKYDIKSIDNDFVKITYKAESTRTSVDSTKLKKEQPDIYNKYSKTSTVKASVVITPKG